MIIIIMITTTICLGLEEANPQTKEVKQHSIIRNNNNNKYSFYYCYCYSNCYYYYKLVESFL